METRKLKVQLSREEVEIRSRDLATKVDEYNRVEEEGKEVAAAHKKRLLALREEMREVPIEWTRGPTTKRCIRLDTGEVIEEMPLTREEMQGDLFPSGVN